MSLLLAIAAGVVFLLAMLFAWALCRMAAENSGDEEPEAGASRPTPTDLSVWRGDRNPDPDEPF